MELLLTLEIDPYDFARNEHQSPALSPEENPDAWNEFWLKSIADSGLEGLEAIRKGSYLVATTGISESNLEIILRQRLEEVEWDFFEEQIGLLSGGIVLKAHNTFLIEPMCCGDLESIQNWEQIFEQTTDDWTQLWIGHPWIYFKKHKESIEFSDYTELSRHELSQVKTRFSVATAALSSEVKKIRKQHNELADNIHKVLEKMGIAHAAIIAALMTGNSSVKQ